MSIRVTHALTVLLFAVLAAQAFAQEADEGIHDDSVTLGKAQDVPPAHTVVGGDTLWGIAEQYFGDPYDWPKVWSFNPEITNPHWIYPGAMVQLRAGQPAQAPADGPTPPFVDNKPKAGQGIYLRDVGYLDEDAFDQAGFIVAAREEQMLLSNSDVAYVRFNKEAKPKPGEHYTVYRKINEDERLKVEKGELVRIMGTVRLDDYDEELDMGRATVVETLEAIERGYKIAPMMRRFSIVEPRTNEKNLKATVIAALFDTKVISNYQVVFLDVGEEQSVQNGNRFYIMRSGDEWRVSVHGRVGREVRTTVPLPEEPKRFPDEIVAEGLIVSVRPKTSALLITNTVRAVSIGDRVEMIEGH